MFEKFGVDREADVMKYDVHVRWKFLSNTWKEIWFALALLLNYQIDE